MHADFVIRTAGDRVLAVLRDAAYVPIVATAAMEHSGTIFVDCANYLDEGPQSWRVTRGTDFHETSFTALDAEESRKRWARFASSRAA
jgi:hypothetical protein